MPIKSTWEKYSEHYAFPFQDWAKPGPYDQPMVNTLRRKKGKETPGAVDINGNASHDSSRFSGAASIPTSAPALAALQTSASVEENNRCVAAPLKVSFSQSRFLTGIYFPVIHCTYSPLCCTSSMALFYYQQRPNCH